MPITKEKKIIIVSSQRGGEKGKWMGGVARKEKETNNNL